MAKYFTSCNYWKAHSHFGQSMSKSFVDCHFRRQTVLDSLNCLCQFILGSNRCTHASSTSSFCLSCWYPFWCSITGALYTHSTWLPAPPTWLRRRPPLPKKLSELQARRWDELLLTVSLMNRMAILFTLVFSVIISVFTWRLPIQTLFLWEGACHNRAQVCASLHV